MNPDKTILGKRVLIVDDEADILETLVDLLKASKVDTASSFEQGKSLLERHDYDIVILDIMGVNGFELLKLADKRDIPALMLTAHALNEDSLKRSIENGAAYFVPKEELTKMAVYVADVLKAREQNKNPWIRWLDRLGGVFDVIFTGPNWREDSKDLSEKLKRTEWY